MKCLKPKNMYKRHHRTKRTDTVLNTVKHLCKTATLKKTKIGVQDQLSLNAGQKYCRMLQMEHSSILLTFIRLPIVIKIFDLSILSGRFTQVLLKPFFFLQFGKIVKR